MLDVILEILVPVISAMVAVLIPIAIAAVMKLLKKWGLEMEANHRDALQSALQNAARIALSRATGGKIAMSAGIDYVKSSVPDAISSFDLSDDRIKELLEPHIVEAFTEKTTGEDH